MSGQYQGYTSYEEIANCEARIRALSREKEGRLSRYNDSIACYNQDIRDGRSQKTIKKSLARVKKFEEQIGDIEVAMFDAQRKLAELNRRLRQENVVTTITGEIVPAEIQANIAYQLYQQQNKPRRR
ncbi:uncharacterized protein UV8b_01471 [Ustilaginoidea virens]|nr:uncharacterized protein UV8b_01471 [Ustilaginoidea virens]QUC17230.1 hypothetical protein UV8b_01471 [Ustilaginoidea virens]